MQTITQLKPLPARPNDGHKGTFGRLLIVGGSAQMIGAPAFGASAAFRSGIGYVQIATARESLLFALSLEPESIGLALPADDADWEQATSKADAIAIGPGLGQLPSADGLVGRVLSLKKPVVLDADALNLLSARDAWPTDVQSRCVLTPHPGEMKRLGKLFGKTEQSQDEADRIDTARRAAEAFGQTVVLKGARTVVTDGQSLYLNTTGDSTLSRAGTGDILTGIIATLLAQSVEPFDAACTAVWIHGRAGEIAGRRLTPRSANARDIISAIGEAMQQYASRYG